MSLTAECPQCGDLENKWEFQGRYCSDVCNTRADGADNLSSLKYDHAVCFTCFRTLKDIEPPKPDFEFVEREYYYTHDGDYNFTMELANQEVTREAACGFQDLTGNATKGMKQRGETDRVITGTICGRCGATSHTDHDPTLTDRATIARLYTLLEDRDELTIDAHELHRTYDNTDDLDLAVGRAAADHSR